MISLVARTIYSSTERKVHENERLTNSMVKETIRRTDKNHKYLIKLCFSWSRKLLTAYHPRNGPWLAHQEAWKCQIQNQGCNRCTQCSRLTIPIYKGSSDERMKHDHESHGNRFLRFCLALHSIRKHGFQSPKRLNYDSTIDTNKNMETTYCNKHKHGKHAQHKTCKY